MKIVAEFEKSKCEDEIAGTMREIYRCGRGFNTDSGKVSVWFDDDGIRIHGGTKARFMPDSQVLSWSDAVKTVSEMLEHGTFATNVELAESQNAEIQRAARSIWYHEFGYFGRSPRNIISIQIDVAWQIPGQHGTAFQKCLKDPRDT